MERTVSKHQNPITTICQYFDLSRYRNCSGLNIIEWSNALEARYVLSLSYYFQQQEQWPPNSKKRIKLEERAIELARNPLPRTADSIDHLAGIDFLSNAYRPIVRRATQEYRRSILEPAIRDLDITDVMTVQNQVNDLAERFDSVRPAMDKLVSFRDMRDGLKDLDGSARRPRAPHPRKYFSKRDIEVLSVGFSDLRIKQDQRMRYTLVDLRQSDDVLIAQFSEWLRETRLKIRKPTPESVSENDRMRWGQVRLLAFLDLELLSRIFGVRLTWDNISKLLYSDLDLDKKEKALDTWRRYVSPLLQPECRKRSTESFLLNRDVLIALKKQAIAEMGRNH